MSKVNYKINLLEDDKTFDATRDGSTITLLLPKKYYEHIRATGAMDAVEFVLSLYTYPNSSADVLDMSIGEFEAHRGVFMSKLQELGVDKAITDPQPSKFILGALMGGDI